MPAQRWDLLLTHATLATLDGDAPFGLVGDGALAVADGRIAWVGPLHALPPGDALHAEDLQGRLLTPGLIDCHTHLVFAGHRAHEFDMRLNGASYAQIARAGGGILSTVRAVRAASEETLLEQSLPRARALLADGVTTLEIKSGYGLDFDNERKLLRVARRIGEQLGVTVRTTYLGAHALPPARWRCCCPGPSTCCAKRPCRRSRCCASTACRWRWPPTATQAPRRCCRCARPCSWPAPTSG